MKVYRVFKLLYNTNNERCYSHLNNNEGDEIMIEIRLLEQLAAFAEYGTLSEAAERLHTSQPTLTRSMKQLEDELGVPLFILCGFYHSIADVVYIVAAWDWSKDLLWYYPLIVVGNYVGCNVRRITIH